MIEQLAELSLGERSGLIAVAIIILSGCLEVSKIQINPWSWLGKAVGKTINGEVITELGNINTKIEDIEQNNKRQDNERQMDRALDARRRILQFADEVRRGVRHSLEHFNNIFEDISFYNDYCNSHKDFKNDKAMISIKIIEDVYEKCSMENEFL